MVRDAGTGGRQEGQLPPLPFSRRGKGAKVPFWFIIHPFENYVTTTLFLTSDHLEWKGFQVFFLMGYARRSRTSFFTHMREKKCRILINKYGNEAQVVTWSLIFVLKLISTFIGQNKEFFSTHVLKKDVLLLRA